MIKISEYIKIAIRGRRTNTVLNILVEQKSEGGTPGNAITGIAKNKEKDRVF